MTTGGDELFVTVGGRDIGLAALLNRVDTEMRKSGDSAVRLGQQYARLAVAQGQPALASQVLAGTMQRAGSASERALLGIQTQASRTNQGLAVLPRTLAGLSHEAASMASGMLGLGTALSVTTALANSFVEAFKFQANLDATTASIKAQLEGFRDANATYAEAIEFGRRFNITQEETNKILLSSVGSLRTSTASVAELETALIRLQSKDVSKPISEAARALAELESGDVTSIKELFRVSAKDALAMRDAIVAGGDSVQVLTAYLDRTQTGMQALALQTQGAAGALRELAIAQENVTKAQGEIATSQAGVEGVKLYAQAWQGLANLLKGDVSSGIAGLAVNQQAAFASQQAHTAALAAGRTEAQAAAIAQQVFTDVVLQGSLATGLATEATGLHTKAVIEKVSAEEAAIAATLAHAQAITDDAAKSALAATASQEVTLAKNALAQAAQLAANTILAGGGNIAATASRLAGSSSQVDILTAAYLRLAAAQATATGVKLQQQTARQLIGADSDVAEIRRQRSASVQADRTARVGAASDAARAEERYQQTLGNTVPALTRARTELAQLTRGSAAYINKQTDIAQLQQKAAKAAGGGGGGGGGGVKLSDQQKLENQLLASQEQFGVKSEDAERAHLNKILDINADFAEKMKDAQDSFAQSQLEGRAGFYDSLGSIEDQGLRQALSAQYEAAFAEADAIAREKGADVGEAFLEAKQQALQAQGQRASEIAEATRQGDKDKAAYLAGVDALYKAAEERKLRTITEGEDSLAAQRDKQIADEAAQYTGKQGEIGDAADTAAARKILAAERAGQAIDAEGLKLDTLTGKYNILGAAGSRAGVTPGPVAPGATPGTQQLAPAVPGATGEGPTLTDLIASLMGKLEELKGAIVGAEKSGADQVSGAVRSLGNSLVR